MNKIFETKVNGNKYYYTKCIFMKKRQGGSDKLQCLLVTRKDNGKPMIGYVLKTDGFPKHANKMAIFQEELPLTSFDRIDSRSNADGNKHFLVMERRS